jgi:acyl-coenzyme A thioesterase PaaI-like protein
MALTMPELLARLERRPQVSSRWFGQQVVAIDSVHHTIECLFDPPPSMASPSGAVQGGFVAAMLDDLCSLAAIVFSTRQIVVPTIEFSVRFFAPVPPAPLSGRGQCRRLGQTVAFLESELFAADGTSLAAMHAIGRPIPLSEQENIP